MKKVLLATLAVAFSFVSSADEKKDWGYVSASLESNNNLYVEDVVNNFYPSEQPQLKDGNTFATNNYLKVDWYKDRLSAGMQVEGYLFYNGG